MNIPILPKQNTKTGSALGRVIMGQRSLRVLPAAGTYAMHTTAGTSVRARRSEESGVTTGSTVPRWG